MNAAAEPVVDALVERYVEDFPREAAADLETMSPIAAARSLGGLPISVLVGFWKFLAPGFAAILFRNMTEALRTGILESLPASQAVRLLGGIDEEEREPELARLSEDIAHELKELLSYPADSAGRFMDTRVVALHGNISAGHALDLLAERKGIGAHFIKLVDAEGRLDGLVDVRDLPFHPRDLPISQLKTPVQAVVGPMDPRDVVVQRFQEFDLQEIPVVDLDGHILGMIRHDTLVGALREVVSADMQSMVGASKDERALSSSWFAVRKRLPWLQINLLTAFLAASVVGLFESTIAKYTALAVLLPVVAGQSGNTGAQALAVTMRGLALREISFRQWWLVTGKEVNAGLWNGIGIAVTCALGVYIWSGSLGLVLVISSSMVISMVMAGMAGALIPIILARIGQDPAVASSIILTTVTDVAGFFSFLGIATLLSSMLGS
ncbi:MAG: magnesium transporter [Alphaproteobacteria bacterium]|nr:magnesium transporter [Alphaproteobacteria bacterium]